MFDFVNPVSYLFSKISILFYMSNKTPSMAFSSFLYLFMLWMFGWKCRICKADKRAAAEAAAW